MIAIDSLQILYCVEVEEEKTTNKAKKMFLLRCRKEEVGWPFWLVNFVSPLVSYM